MSQHADTIRRAHALGYRALTDGGVVLGDTVVTLSLPSDAADGAARRYYYFHVPRSGVDRGLVFVHKFCAFCWFGDAALARGVHVRHLDGNPLNNSRANLALGNARQNSLDRAEDARKTQVLKAAKARRALTDDQVRELVTLSRQGWRGSALAAHFGVRKSTVSEILSGKLYSETTGIAPRVRSSSGHGPAGAASAPTKGGTSCNGQGNALALSGGLG